MALSTNRPIFRWIYWLIHLFTFHVSRQEIAPYGFSLWSGRGDPCSVHFGIQSSIPHLAVDTFLESAQLNRQSVLDVDDVLRGRCTEFANCPPWRRTRRYPPTWMRSVFRELRCGLAEDGALLYCCPDVINEVWDTSRVVFPDASPDVKRITQTAPALCDHHPNRRLLPGLNLNDCIAPTSATGRILGGKSARLGQYPWIVRLAYKPNGRVPSREHKETLSNSRDLDAAADGDGGSEGDGGLTKIDFRCGGVLLNDRYVLTAAHCLRDTDDRVYMVRLGELDERSDPDCESAFSQPSSYEHYGTRRLAVCADRVIDVAVIQSIVHERYNEPYRQNDIALLRLNASINPTEWIRPICLPFDWLSLRHARASSDPVLVGWGRDDSFQFAQTLQRVSLKWYNVTECGSIYNNAQPRSISISESLQFCLGGGDKTSERNGGGEESEEGGRDACQGDSGGPVLLTDPSDRGAEGVNRGDKVYAVGIISFGPWMCGNGYPSVYTWVPAYLTWILDNIVA